MHDEGGAEPNGAVAFRGAPLADIFIILFGVFFLALAAAPIWSDAPSYKAYLARAGGILVGLWVIGRGILSLRLGRDVMLSIGKMGIFDRRISDEWIPWTAITKVETTWGYKGASPEPADVSVLLLHLDPKFALQLRDKPFARFNRMLERWSGTTGVRVGMFGVNAKSHQVTQALDRFFPQWRQDSKT